MPITDLKEEPSIFSAIHQACATFSVQVLLDAANPISVSECSRDNTTPLFYLLTLERDFKEKSRVANEGLYRPPPDSVYFWQRACSILLAQNADPNANGNSKYSPLQYAVLTQSYCCMVLILAGADFQLAFDEKEHAKKTILGEIFSNPGIYLCPYKFDRYRGYRPQNIYLFLEHSLIKIFETDGIITYLQTTPSPVKTYSFFEYLLALLSGTFEEKGCMEAEVERDEKIRDLLTAAFIKASVPLRLSLQLCRSVLGNHECRRMIFLYGVKVYDDDFLNWPSYRNPAFNLVFNIFDSQNIPLPDKDYYLWAKNLQGDTFLHCLCRNRDVKRISALFSRNLHYLRDCTSNYPIITSGQVKKIRLYKQYTYGLRPLSILNQKQKTPLELVLSDIDQQKKHRPDKETEKPASSKHIRFFNPELERLSTIKRIFVEALQVYVNQFAFRYFQKINLQSHPRTGDLSLYFGGILPRPISTLIIDFYNVFPGVLKLQPFNQKFSLKFGTVFGKSPEARSLIDQIFSRAFTNPAIVYAAFNRILETLIARQDFLKYYSQLEDITLYQNGKMKRRKHQLEKRIARFFLTMYSKAHEFLRLTGLLNWIRANKINLSPAAKVHLKISSEATLENLCSSKLDALKSRIASEPELILFSEKTKIMHRTVSHAPTSSPAVSSLISTADEQGIARQRSTV